MTIRSLLARAAIALALVLPIPALAVFVGGAWAQQEDEELDPARNIALACPAGTLSATPFGRSNRNIVHLANACGIVGTDLEFSSRTHVHAGGERHRHNYAFVGTMGSGFIIWDVTNPLLPAKAGSWLDAGWQNDIAVYGSFAVSTFDGVSGEPSTGSLCLKTNFPTASDQGVDVVRLIYNETTALFQTVQHTCVANPPGGTHTATWNPTGKWLALSNSSSDWAVDLVDMRTASNKSSVRHLWRFIDASRVGPTRCPTPITGAPCVVATGPGGSNASGLWRPHDVHFSSDGNTMFVAALNSTFIVDVSQALQGVVRTLAIIPNSTTGIQLSHQADVSRDGKILVISDEKGGGTSNTACNESPNGAIGGLHFYALAPVVGRPDTAGASRSNPVLLGSYYNPNPLLGPETLQSELDALRRQLPRLERGCTVHVFRLGGNGNSAPGPITGNVSTIGPRQLMTAWYGAGVWWVSFAGPPSSTDGTSEHPDTTWGNTLGWNVQPAADTWSAKEYQGFIYAGDMIRGFDVYACSTPRFTQCPRDPVVALTKSGPATAAPGTRVRYTLSYTNAGPAAATNSEIIDQLPAGSRYISAPGGSFNSATKTVTWKLGTVEPGASGTVQLVVLVPDTTPAGTSLLNRAEFRGDLTVSPPAVAKTVVVTP